jgi:hypothetical protein
MAIVVLSVGALSLLLTWLVYRGSAPRSRAFPAPPAVDLAALADRDQGRDTAHALGRLRREQSRHE